jgi:nitrate/nitrite-specific signal transduction histidine kinase
MHFLYSMHNVLHSREYIKTMSRSDLDRASANWGKGCLRLPVQEMSHEIPSLDVTNQSNIRIDNLNYQITAPDQDPLAYQTRVYACVLSAPVREVMGVLGTSNVP